MVASPKEISRKNENIERVKEQVFFSDTTGHTLFTPKIICPIAQGGNELGIVLANGYEDRGITVSVYPLMYSIKTRKQRYPWTAHDGEFLNENIPGNSILLTEDWVTTGNTVRGILNELEGIFPHEVRIATLKRDPDQSRVPLLDKYEFYVGSLTKYAGPKTDALR